MKKGVIFVLFWIFPALAQSFLPGTEDIPLMDGLVQVEETASFDNPSERMVLISAETTLPRGRVLNFYRQSLKNLGWQTKNGRLFLRGNDTFEIEITPVQKKSSIQFRLTQSNP